MSSMQRTTFSRTSPALFRGTATTGPTGISRAILVPMIETQAAGVCLHRHYVAIASDRCSITPVLPEGRTPQRRAPRSFPPRCPLIRGFL
jgi:hypothetical protein